MFFGRCEFTQDSIELLFSPSKGGGLYFSPEMGNVSDDMMHVRHVIKIGAILYHVGVAGALVMYDRSYQRANCPGNFCGSRRRLMPPEEGFRLF